MVAKIPTMAITTMSSMIVKPLMLFLILGIITPRC
jgi:hypothetical protein